MNIPRAIFPNLFDLKFALVAALTVVGAFTASAQSDFIAVGSGTWNAPTGVWSPSVPTASGTVHIGGGNSVNYNAGASPSIIRIYVGDDQGVSSGTGSLLVSGGTLTTNPNAAGAIIVGRTANSVGTLNVSGGLLRATGANGGGLQVGGGSNSQGSVVVSDSGNLTLTGGVQLGIASGATGTMLVSGGNVTTSTGATGGIFYVGGRITGASTKGVFTQTGGTVTIDDDFYMAVGFSGTTASGGVSTQNITGTASFTGGTYTGNMRVGRQGDIVTSGGGTGTLVIGAAATMVGRSQAWDISGTGEIVFQLGSTTAFNAVDLTAATSTALVFSQDGAKITIDGTNLAFGEGLGPISLFLFDSGSGPSELSKSNVDFFYTGFNPQFAPELVWTDTSLQLNLNVVPEPSTVAMLTAAGLGLLVLRRRRRQA